MHVFLKISNNLSHNTAFYCPYMILKIPLILCALIMILKKRECEFVLNSYLLKKLPKHTQSVWVVGVCKKTEAGSYKQKQNIQSSQMLMLLSWGPINNKWRCSSVPACWWDLCNRSSRVHKVREWSLPCRPLSRYNSLMGCSTPDLHTYTTQRWMFESVASCVTLTHPDSVLPWPTSPSTEPPAGLATVIRPAVNLNGPSLPCQTNE